MKIPAITNVCPISVNRQNNNKKISCDNLTFSGKVSSQPDEAYASALFNMNQINQLRAETQNFPKDIEYREGLLKNAGLPIANQHKLRAIVGVQEIESIMKSFNENEAFYSVGENDVNIKNCTMRANIHMHTLASDGSLSVKELLDKSAEYADKVVKTHPKSKMEPFVVAITDHDTTESAKEAIKIIYENPLKYRNLRVILGVEMTTFNDIRYPDVSKPTNVHTLMYGIDPNDKMFSDFIDGIKEKKSKAAEMMISSANESYMSETGVPQFFSLKEGRQQYNPLRKNILGIYNNVDNYIKNKVAMEHVILKDFSIVSALKEHNMPIETSLLMDKMRAFYEPLTGNNKVVSPLQTIPNFISACTGMDVNNVENILEEGLKQDKVSELNKTLQDSIEPYKITFNTKYRYIPDFKDLYEGTSAQRNVMFGIAHPIDCTQMVKSENDKYTFLSRIYKNFKESCREKAKFTEVYYQSYKPERARFNSSPETRVFLDKISSIYKLFKTGSADSHGLSVFKRL